VSRVNHHLTVGGALVHDGVLERLFGHELVQLSMPRGVPRVALADDHRFRLASFTERV
jgi:hypothetical protein